MLVEKINREYNFPLTQELARQQLKNEKIIAQYYSNDNDYHSIVHSHPFYEIIMPISGNSVYSVMGNLYPVDVGDVICIPKEIFHAANREKGTDVYDRLVLQVDSSIWNLALARSGLADPLWDNTVTVVNKDFASTWDLRGLFDRMINTRHLNADIQSIVLESQLLEFQMLLEQTTSDHTTVSPNATSQVVAKAVSYIQSHFTEPELNVARLAQESFLSREYLSRIFKEYTMESIHSYLTSLRMQYCRRLIASGKSVLDACLESGFNNYSNFYKSFRNLYGITPTEYKKQLSLLKQMK